MALIAVPGTYVTEILSLKRIHLSAESQIMTYHCPYLPCLRRGQCGKSPMCFHICFELLSLIFVHKLKKSLSTSISLWQETVKKQRSLKPYYTPLIMSRVMDWAIASNFHIFENQTVTGWSDLSSSCGRICNLLILQEDRKHDTR